MDVASFFKEVVTAPIGGWFCLAHAKILDDEKRTKESWVEEFFSWPDELPNIINRVATLVEGGYDIYFSPYLFMEPSSIKENAIVGRTIVADLDEANVLTLQLEPTILVETSPGRHQGYWILTEELDREEHESLSMRLTYSIPRCDRTGWFLGKKVRVPETSNNKYISGPQQVRIVSSGGKRYSKTHLEHIPTTKELFGKTAIPSDEDFSWAEAALNQSVGPQEMLSRVRSKVPTIVARYNLQQQDRSAALWSLYMQLFRAGLNKSQIFFIAYHSVNNKFKELRYGGIRELAKDVLRAELATKMQLPDIKAKIRDARKLGESPQERSEYIARLVKEHLDKLGNFIHASNDSCWFIREDTGRPVQLGYRSEHLLHMLDNVFGINASEKEATYITHSLAAMVMDLPVTGKIATLSSYDHRSRTLVVHTGMKDVLVVKPNGITRETNGYNGLVFLWNPGNTTISPRYQALDRSWEDELFDDCLNNVLSISKEDAKALLRVWLITVLLRDGLTSRPILALMGMPGSGKSTLFRRVYALLYGRERGLETVTKEDHFDHAMAVHPLVVLDNVDTFTKWLPDRLAATVSPTAITKRKLYTDSDVVVINRQAMLGITAHNFTGREDVTDRMLLLMFERLEHFKPETIILDKITQLRNGLWGAILADIQKVINTDIPLTGYPQFRIEDFGQYGHWIATALGISEQFSRGIKSVQNAQRSFNLEEDMLLVDVLERCLGQEVLEDIPAGQLWLRLRRYCRGSEEKTFDRRYQNAVALGRKFWTLLDSLRELFDVEWRIYKNVRVWTITKKVEVGTNGTAVTVGTSSN